MTRIEEVGAGATREELLSSSRLSDLREVAHEGAEIAALLQQIREPGENPEERPGIPITYSLQALSGVLMEYFYSVLNFVNNREEVENYDRV